MAPALTWVGFCWSFLSLLASGAICSGFISPYWLMNGYITYSSHRVTVSFGCYRRCGFLKSNFEGFTLSDQCGRYRLFDDIPSMWWKLTTCCVGAAGAISLLITFMSFPGCCCPDIITKRYARTLGALQAFATLLAIAGLAFYPMGWANLEVRESCGPKSAPFNPGNCSLGYPFWTVLGGASLLLVCSSLSFYAARPAIWQRLAVEDDDNLEQLTSD